MARSRGLFFLVAILFLGVSSVTAQTKVTSVIHRTSASGAACGPASVNCNGGWHRTLAGNVPTNVIPQEADVLLEYQGTLAADKWISLVDASLNNNNPCGQASIAAAPADNLHTGAMQGRAIWPAGTGSGSIFKIPQATGKLLDAAKTYTVCYAETDGSATDNTWAATSIMIRVSKLFYVRAYGVDHRTTGTIPNHPSLTMTYTGTILNDRWISLVDTSLASSASASPCDNGIVAAAPADSQHSGSILATNNVFLVSTSTLSAAKTFAICYAESGGITSSVWRDSGIRVKRSAVTGIAYGVDTFQYGEGSRRIASNRNSNDHDGIAEDKFPRIAGAKIEYVGELAADKYISLVDDSLMDPDAAGTDNMGNPCMYPVVAAADPGINAGGSVDNRLETGAAQGRLVTGAAGGKMATIAQATNNLLDPTKTYAVCYAEGNGDTNDLTWSDSYIRLQITKLERISHHAAQHSTIGHLPNTGEAAGTELLLSVRGSLSGATIQYAFVDATKSPAPSSGGINSPQPCLTATNANAAADNTGLQSGPISGTVGGIATSSTQFKVDTTVLHTGSISGSTLTEKFFALCYSENAGVAYADSGIRVTVSKLQMIKHGKTLAPYTPRNMLPVTASFNTNGHSHGLSSAENVIPQATGQKITYVEFLSGSQGSITGSSVIGSDHYVSLVEASINGNKPCAVSTIAGAVADQHHSGSIKAASGTREITIPQSTLLDATKIFAVCYAITSGSTADDSWADSYVRFSISKVQAITSVKVEHRVNGYTYNIPSAATTVTIPTGINGGTVTQNEKIDITYSGSLAQDMYLNIIDASHNGNMPCGVYQYALPRTAVSQVTYGSTYTSAMGSIIGGNAAAKNTAIANGEYTGDVQATTGTSAVLFTTDNLDAAKTFAVCYSEDGTTWYETGIRVKRSAVKSIVKSSGMVGVSDRTMTAAFHSINRISNFNGEQQQLTYTGELANNKYISIVDASLGLTGEPDNPCVLAANAAGTQDAQHSGKMQAGATNKLVTMTTASSASGIFNHNKTYAACYSSDDTAWFDTYIRFKVTEIDFISQTIGKWGTTDAGTLQKHFTYAQLPHQYPNAAELGITLSGTSMANGMYISFVAARDSLTTVHGIPYESNACVASNAAKAQDSTHSGPLLASGNVVNTLDSTSLSTSHTYALCTDGGLNQWSKGSTQSSGWTDSGIRITFSQVINVQFSSVNTGINPRDMTSTFVGTNVLPKTADAGNTLTYMGTLGAGMYISLVNAVKNSNSPCTDGNEAAASISAHYSGALTATGKTVTVNSNSFAEANTYAVCYSATGATTGDTWHDSYIRVHVSAMEALVVGGVTIKTTGQIPNVNTGDGYEFEMTGGILATAKVVLIDEALNSGRACKDTTLIDAGADTQRTAVSTATAKKVTNFDTHALDTTKTFAYCYSTDGGLNYFDSGIRVTTTKVWNMLYSSGVTGPACALGTQGPVNAGCKLDTKPRDMTSVPLATNILPQQANVVLTYKGTLAADQFISIVDASLNGGNPCANGAVAGAAADSTHSGVIKSSPGTTAVTIPQQTLLDASKTYAVCYDSRNMLPPETYGTPLTGAYTAIPVASTLDAPTLIGISTVSSQTWRDSFIRLKVSKVSGLRIRTANFPNTALITDVLTHGMIPSQEKDKQVVYTYLGSLAADKSLQLVDASTGGAADADTGITRPLPCATTANNAATATGTTKSVTALTSQGTGSTGVDASKTYALCYSEDGTNLIESGIRITIPEVQTVRYIDTNFEAAPFVVAVPTTRATYTRTLTSELKATNRLPQTGSVRIGYDGILADNEHIAFVDQTANGGYPCANPAVVAASASATTTGAATNTAIAKTKTLDTTALGGTSHRTKYFAVCYASGDGSSSDITWRDSYIRFALSKITKVQSYGVDHVVQGQVPNHATAKVQYTGSLGNGGFARLVAVDSMTLSGAEQTAQFAGTNYQFPCTTPQTTLGATLASPASIGQGNKAHGTWAGPVANVGDFGNGTVVTFDTTAISVEKVFALCYAESTDAAATPMGDIFEDSGIRITVPKIFSVLADSGYTSDFSATLDGIPARIMSSSESANGASFFDRPTNRHPQIADVVVKYVTHSTLAGSADGYYLGLVDASENNNDPCTIGANPMGAASNTNTGPGQGANLAGVAGNGRMVTVPQATLLNLAKTFAVCYSADNQDATWHDSYVRLKISQISSIGAQGVTVKTYGSLPNTPTADLMKYVIAHSTTLTGGTISLVDDTINPISGGGAVVGGQPCADAYAKNAASTDTAKYSGPMAFTGTVVTTASTQALDTAKVFAVCYTAVAGYQTGWVDTGLRVTLPRVWNVQRDSGHVGPACPMVKTDGSCTGTACTDYATGSNSMLNSGCKLDTKAKDMTSKRLATNTFPREAGQMLKYIGTMAQNRYISLVAQDQNGGNPCVRGSTAGMAAGGGGAGDARLASGPSQAAAGSSYVTIAQGATNLLDKTKIFAVCYDDGADVTSTAYAGLGVTTTIFGTVTPTQQIYNYVEANMGTTNSKTWHDSFIRLKMSDITSLNLALTNLPWSATTTTYPIYTTGMIPAQGADEQAVYTYVGSLGNGAKISLVNAALESNVDPQTGIASDYPCDGANGHTVATTTPADGTHSGVISMTGASKTFTALATTGLETDKSFALCYSVTGAASANNWFDSGIRITIPKVQAIKYNGYGPALQVDVRSMTSYVTALNKLPQLASVSDLEYDGDLANNKHISFVSTQLNRHNPCVNPTVASTSGTTSATAPATAGATDKKFVTNSLALQVGTSDYTAAADTGAYTDAAGNACSTWVGLDCSAAEYLNGFTAAQTADLLSNCATSCKAWSESRTYAVCYAEGDGTATDLSWRDSFVRVTMSQIAEVNTHLHTAIKHLTVGQLPDHPNLGLTYTGSLPSGSRIALVQFDLRPSSYTGGAGPFGFPCTTAEAEPEANADTQHTGVVQATGTTAYINTQNLQRENGGVIQSYAICYTTSNSASAGTHWADAGIRLTISDVYEVHYSSGVTGPSNKEDTRPRAMSSEPLATNRIPRATGQVISYQVHSSSALMQNGKHMSLVSTHSAVQAQGNPCMLPAVAAATIGPRHSGSQTGTANAVTFNTLNMNYGETYALCYAHGAGDNGDASWRDSYIRVQLSKITSLKVLDQVIKTVGQLPNTLAQPGKWNQPADLASTGIAFEYDGNLAVNKMIALVDSSVDPYVVCTTARATAASSTVASGTHTAGAADKKITTMDTSGLSTSLAIRKTSNDLRYDSGGAAFAWGDTTVGAFALCYSEDAGTTWSDSGIRVTVPKVHTIIYKSGHIDPLNTYYRYMTSHRAATNRVPRVANVPLHYVGDLANNQYVSLVKADGNSGYPCADPAAAALVPSGTPSNGALASGPMQAGTSDKDITVPQGATNLLAGNNAEFAVCYTDGDGGNTDVLWRDSYIRVKSTDLATYSTKSVTHRTYGQIPHHAAGLEYTYAGAIVAGKYVSLVDETLGTYGSAVTPALGVNIPNPCECTGGACNTLAKTTAGASATGVAQAAGFIISGHATTQMDTSKVFALCYSSDNTEYFDSGIRITIPKVYGIEYSGLTDQQATARGKTARLMKSVLPALQPGAQIVSNVLPRQQNMAIKYVGDLAVSQWISLVDASRNSNNPCINPQEAGMAADASHSGSSVACASSEYLCKQWAPAADTNAWTDVHGNGCATWVSQDCRADGVFTHAQRMDLLANCGTSCGAGHSGDKEVTFPQTVAFDHAADFAVCYAEGDGSGTDVTWRDSYIRVSISQINSITTAGVTHTDHGTVGDYAAAAQLSVYINKASTFNQFWLNFVDESLNNNDPCVEKTVAASTGAGRSGVFPSDVSAYTPVAAMTTNGMDETKQYAVCYATTDGTVNDVTWADSGVRLMLTTLNTITYNNIQLPTGQMMRVHTSGQSTVGGTNYQLPTYNHVHMHRLAIPPVTTGNTQFIYDGSIANAQHLAIVSIATDTTGNYGDPCASAPLVYGASASSTGKTTATVKTFDVSNAALRNLVGTEFTFCYVEGGANHQTNAAYSGMGKVPSGWRDSYIRLKLSKVQAVTSHGAYHYTMGHIANVQTLGLTYTGSLDTDKWLSIVDETGGSNNPCGSAATAAAVASTTTSGAVKARTGTRQCVFDTRALDTTKIFAVCYSEDNTNWLDSGVRVTISRVSSVTVNDEQQGTTTTGQYARLMDSDNVCIVNGVDTCSDLFPLATNRFGLRPDTGNIGLIYSGNTVHNGNGATETSIPVGKWLAVVSTSVNAQTQFGTNNQNPCAAAAMAGAAASSSGSANARHRSGPAQANPPSGRLVPIVQTIGDQMIGSDTVAVCYAETNGGTGDYTWRDSYVRMKVSKIQYIQSYGINHYTDGMVASKPYLRLFSGGRNDAQARMKLMESTKTAGGVVSPCDKSNAGVVPTGLELTLNSGDLADNTANKHTVKTDALDVTKTFAVCYAEGDGSVTDNTWEDSGIRLQTPKLTHLTYSDPVRNLYAKTCFDSLDLYGLANCQGGVTGGGATATGGSTAYRNSQLPRSEDVVVAYGGTLATGKYISLVAHTLGKQTNNPCRDATAAAKLRASGGSTDARLQTGALQATGNVVTIPQKIDGSNTGLDGMLLDDTRTYAVCYAEGDGSTSDNSWRDSYVRVTMSKIKTITASDMIITTSGTLGNVPSLKIVHAGSLATAKWLTIVDTTENSNYPCDKTYAGAAGLRRPWTLPQDSTSVDNKRSANLQAGPGSKMMDFDTTLLKGNSAMYEICYAEGDGSATDTTWRASGITLRFLEWINSNENRVSAGSAHNLLFSLNTGTNNFAATARAALVKDATDCSGGPGAPLLSNGASFKRAIPAGGTVTMPSGSGATNPIADGYMSCSDGTSCNTVGAYGDLDLQEGSYAVCFCDGLHGNGGCDHGNEFIKTGVLQVITKPRLGRMNLADSHSTYVRAVENKDHTYNIKGSSNAGYHVKNGDKIFFATGSCATIPGSNGVSATTAITLKEYDSVLASSTLMAARVQLPTTLTSDSGSPRNLVACFATAESLLTSGGAQDYALLDDQLQVIASPRMGPKDSPGTLRALPLSQAAFTINTLAHGDRVYFRKKVYNDATDCTIGSYQPDGLIVSNIATTSTATKTKLLSAFGVANDGTGKVALDQTLTGEDMGDGVIVPANFAACFVPAGAIENLHDGTYCPHDNPYVAIGGGANTNEDDAGVGGGTCNLVSGTPRLINTVLLTDSLSVFDEPTDALVNSWFMNHVYELKFTQPQFGVYGTSTFSTGMMGDIVVLQKGGCSGVASISPASYTIGASHSAKMVLEEYGGETVGDEKGGAAKIKAIAEGKVNELPIGVYTICYATKESEGNDDSDYTPLVRTFEILQTTATRPSMSVPRSVLMGTDIVVSWESTVNLQTKIQSQNSWIGLYKKGSCMGSYWKHGDEWTHSDNDDVRNSIANTQIEHTDPNVRPTGSYIESNQHECFIAMHFIEGGVQSGVVRFSAQEYKIGDVFNVRFFQGDSRNGQGRICRGIAGVPGETSIDCILEPALISDDIEVFVDSAKLDHLNDIPGMEVVFNDQRARFQRGSRANKLT
jgi:hypothetical protein